MSGTVGDSATEGGTAASAVSRIQPTQNESQEKQLASPTSPKRQVGADANSYFTVRSSVCFLCMCVQVMQRLR